MSGLFKAPKRFVESRELPDDFTERRLNRRIYDYWQESCDGDVWPRPSKVCGDTLGDDWDNCFVLDVSSGVEFSRFEYLGKNLAPYSGIYLSGSQDWMQTVLDKVTDQVPHAISTCQPVICDDELILFDRRHLLFRTVLLPLGEEGRGITHFLGAANGRIVEETDASTPLKRFLPSNRQ